MISFSLLIQFIKEWFVRLFVGKAEFIPEVWSTDVWERAFQLADVSTDITIVGPEIEHLDYDLLLHNNTIDELCYRIEQYITCLEYQLDKPENFILRKHEPSPVTVLDFCYSSKVGYRSFPVILEILIQKMSVVHYLMESKSINETHPYYQYMRKHFTFIMTDVVTVFEMFLELRER